MSKSERMSSVDTAWLRMDSPSNLMTIVGVKIFEAPVPYERLAREIEAHLLKYDRFRQRVVYEVGGPAWEWDEQFDLAHHLRRVALPGGADKAALETYVGELASEPLDARRPLWQFDLVERYEGGSALVARIHHCIADGIALIGVLLSLTSTTPDGPPLAYGAPVGRGRVDHVDPNPWRALIDPMTKATVRAIETTGTVTSKMMSTTSQLMIDPLRMGEYMGVANRFAQDAARIALMGNDTMTALKGKPGGDKVVAWCEPLPLGEVKAVGKALGASVNDVLLSSVAGALRAYLVSRGDAVERAEIRAMVPVNLRAPGDEHKLGNRFGLAPIVLPIGIAHPIERLYEVRRRMEELKGGYQPLLAMGVLGAVGFMPKLMQDEILGYFSRKATAVMTNVPGPQQPLYLAGAKLRQIMFWVPQSGDIGMGVSILSYAGGVQFGVITDRALTPDPHAIIERFAPEFEKLVMTLLMAGEAGGETKSGPPPRGRADAQGEAPLPEKGVKRGHAAKGPAPRKQSAFGAARRS